jgi:hypothetical protein
VKRDSLSALAKDVAALKRRIASIPTIASIQPVNQVQDHLKVEALYDAYTRDPASVPKVLVVFHEGSFLAITGSHRLAALRQLFGKGLDVEEAESLGIVEIASSSKFGHKAKEAIGRLHGRGMSAEDYDAIAADLPAEMRKLAEEQAEE